MTMNITMLSARYDLQNEVNKASLYVYPLIITLSLTANIINIYVLCRRNLRCVSCTHYFLSFSLSSVLYTCEVPLMMFLRLRIGFAVTLSTFGCPLQTFVINVLPLFISLMLVLASVDRNFVSSSSVQMRRIGQVHISRWIIIIIVIFNIIYGIPYLFIYRFNSHTNQCISYSSTIALLFLSSRIVLSYMVIPLAMILFGLLTIGNIRSLTNRIAPVGIQFQRRNRSRRTDGQLARMLIIQVGAYLLFTIPAGVTYTMFTFFPSMNTPFIVQLRIIFNLWQQAIYFLPFFLNILSSSIYQEELRHMLEINYTRNHFLHQVSHFLRTYLV